MTNKIIKIHREILNFVKNIETFETINIPLRIVFTVIFITAKIIFYDK